MYRTIDTNRLHDAQTALRESMTDLLANRYRQITSKTNSI